MRTFENWRQKLKTFTHRISLQHPHLELGTELNFH